MKWRFGFLVILLLCVLMLPLMSEAETQTGKCGDNLTYTLTDDGTLTISGTGEMYGYSRSWTSDISQAPWKDAPKKVIIEEGVTSIGGYAFYNCSNLTCIIIPKGVTSIGNYSFSGCSNLTSITIPEAVTTIGTSAFNGCSSLTNVTIPEGVTSIGREAFAGCSNLKSITIPEAVTTIGTSAFNGCSSLTNVTIPEGVTSISIGTFGGCSSLMSITIPESVTSIDAGAFHNCSSLTSITIPEGVTAIPNDAFYDCSSLTSVTIPEGVTSIGEYAFYGCSSLTSITIPEKVTNIGYAAFLCCPAKKYAHIGTDGAKTLSKQGYSFRVPETHYDLQYLFTNGEITGLLIRSVDQDVTSFSIPDGVTSIARYAFQNCKGLASIVIPAHVSSIGYGAFSGCTSLSKVLFYGETTSFDSYVFFSPYPTIYCYEYSDADAWATEQGYEVVYLDNVDLEDLLSITLQDDFRLISGQSRTIGVNIFPDVEHLDVTWISSAPEIVSVENGVATAIAPGTATITATMGILSDSVEITAYAVAEDFELSAAECWVIAKENVQLAVTSITPIEAEVTFTWASADTTIATVSEDGVVSTKKPGDVVISVDSDNGLHRECLVHACYPVTEIAFTEAETSAYIGFSLQLTANVTMRTQSCVNHLITFTSSDETIATVDENGLVTPIKAGTVTITATADSDVSASCTVTVKEMFYIILPADLNTIETEAFVGAAFEAVIIPDGCTAIGSRAFADCPNLVYVRIPASVVSIAEDAFAGCGQVMIDRITP